MSRANSRAEEFPYIHGFSETEQTRLRRQARMAEPLIYRDIDFAHCDEILEVGSGVGAQTEILLRRFPELNVAGIDLNQRQLSAADAYLNNNPVTKGRVQLHEMDAADLSFASNHFDGAFLCWVLEHIPQPERVLNEVRRVLRPGAQIYVTEVMNASFFLDPYSSCIWKYWMAFNDHQYEVGGDPFIGAKLGNLLLAGGFRDVQTEVKTFHYDNRQPDHRKSMLTFWEELLLSAADQLITAGKLTEQEVDNMRQEFKQVKNDPNAVFFYSFIQAKAVVF